MARYQPNKREVGQFLRADPDLRRVLRSVSDRIADRARAIAPVRTGAYRSSIRIAPASWSSLRGGRRMAFDVLADVDYATVVEVGRRNVAGREPAATVDQFGRRQVRRAGRHVLHRAAEST